jgi:5-formyltetrahydrofolate cyclo-ligase
MPDPAPSKAQLRSELRRRRRALNAQQQLAAAQAVAAHCRQLPGFSNAHRIALYLAQDGEIDTTPLNAICRKLNMQLFLPVIGTDNSLSFARWDNDSQLKANRYGIPEPPGDAWRCPTEELDILIMPLVGWDRRGGRLGMGGGFYDRTLAGVSGPLRVGLAHAIQELEDIPREEWDICVDFIATDTALHHCQETL